MMIALYFFSIIYAIYAITKDSTSSKSLAVTTSISLGFITVLPFGTITLSFRLIITINISLFIFESFIDLLAILLSLFTEISTKFVLFPYL